MERTDRIYHDAVHPLDGKTVKVAITSRRALHVAKRGMGAVQETLVLVPWALKNWRCAFEGLRWEEDEDTNEDGDGWICLSCLPDHAYHKNGDPRVPAWPGEVFLVFVNHDFVAYHWRWDKQDIRYPDRPEGWETRFHKPRPRLT